MVMLLAFTMVGNLQFRRVKREHAQLAALILAAFLGTIVSGLLIGRSLMQMFTIDGMFWGIVVFTAAGIAIGVVAATLLVYRERESRAFAELQTSESQRYQLEKQVLEARLKLMQAQIEPHFLFNTLANVQHLVEAHSPLAATTLESLITYLRAALPEMREDGTTLGREATMAQAYLDIQRLRMGPRLDFSMQIPEPLRDASFPPMMLLTLVENAIKHGLENLQQGGRIEVNAALVEGFLVVSVADTGQGLSPSGSLGVGLGNIRERLAALYGKTAKLLLEENLPQGVVARILLPYKP
jgi:sensor histidine kinase YesM